MIYTTEQLEKMLSDATPGPWRVEQDTTLIWGACNSDDTSNRGMGYPIAECRITAMSSWAKGPDADAGEANARGMAMWRDIAADLIAARRRLEAVHGLHGMLAALRNELSWSRKTREIADKITAALAALESAQ